MKSLTDYILEFASRRRTRAEIISHCYGLVTAEQAVSRVRWDTGKVPGPDDIDNFVHRGRVRVIRIAICKLARIGKLVAYTEGEQELYRSV